MVVGTVALAVVFAAAPVETGQKDWLGYTALMSAAAVGDEETVRLELLQGVKVNEKAHDGGTALMRAAVGGHARVVAILLGAGADTATKSKHGRTALDWAKAARHPEIAERLATRDSHPPDEDSTGSYRPRHPRLTLPVVIKQVQPRFTDSALSQGISGNVVVEVIVLSDGRVRPRRILESLDLELDCKAIDAVRKWKFQPGRLEGRAVDVIAEIIVSFKILEKK